MNGVKFNKLPKEKQKYILNNMINCGTNHEGLSNKEFASQDKIFQNACEEKGLKPTKRQASKYRNKTNQWR